MKSDTSTKWYIRITAPWEHLEAKYKLVREWVDHVSSAIGYHIGNKTGKPHCHIALELKTILQKQSLDTRMKKLFGVKGSDYGSKPWDGDKKALSYLYHDKVGKVEVNIPLTDEELLEIKNLVVVYDQIVTTAKQKASFKCVEVVLDAIKESGRTWSTREISRYIFSGVRAGKWHPVGYFQMEKYIDEIRIKQGSDEDASGVIDAMTSNFLSRYEKIF